MASRHQHSRILFASLRGALGVSLLIFVAIVLLVNAVSKVYGSRVVLHAVDAVNNGIAADLKHLSMEGDAVAQNELLKQYLLAGDSYKILGILSAEKDRRLIGLMGVANKDGIIISRTLTVSSRGDNVFLVSPQGRAVAEGKRPASVEVSSFDPTQLLITTGRPITAGSAMVGALFANYLANDEYATTFKKKYLFDGVEVAFYTHGYGIYGSSISDSEQRSVLSSYFHVDSDWIKNGKTGDIVKFDSGAYYRIENIEFPGLEHSPGGVLIFVPYYGYSFPVRAVIVLMTLVIFGVIVAQSYHHMGKSGRTRYYYWSIATAFVILLSLVYTINRLAFVDYIALRRVPYILYNSTLRLQPESGVFDRSFERTVSIIVDTGDEHINVLSTHVSFDPDLIHVTDLDAEHSVCSNFLEKTIDAIQHEIRVSCIVTNPGFSGSLGTVATIVFEPKKVGSFDLGFNDDSQVLANDGLGTNVLRQAINGNYRIVPNAIEKSSAANQVDPYIPIVFSPTHPNSARWYNSRSLDFVWTKVGTTTDYVYAFDQSTSTVPFAINQVVGNKLTLSAPSDGIFYFHVAPLSGSRIGQTRHYKVMIDTEPPVNVRILSSQDEAHIGDVLRLEFSGEDSMSGTQNMMYIDMNTGTFLPVGKQAYVPLVDVGTIPIKLRVYDKAGNYVQVTRVFKVTGTVLQTILHAR